MTVLYLAISYVIIFSIMLGAIYSYRTRNFLINGPLWYCTNLKEVLAPSFNSAIRTIDYFLGKKFTFRKFENFSTTNWYLFLNKVNKFDSIISKRNK